MVVLLFALSLAVPPGLIDLRHMDRSALVDRVLDRFERKLDLPAARLAKINRVRVDMGLAALTIEQIRSYVDAEIEAYKRDFCESRRAALEQSVPATAAQWAIERDAAESRRVAFVVAAGIVVPELFAP